MKTEKHHNVGFQTIEQIDWHLRNLWSGGFECIVEKPSHDHRTTDGKKRRGKDIGRDYWQRMGLQIVPGKKTDSFKKRSKPISPYFAELITQ